MKIFRNISQFILLLVVFSGTSWAEGVTLEIQPSSIAVLPSYSEVQGRVVLKNGAKAAVKGASISVLSNDGFEVEVGKPSVQAAAPGQAIVWPITINLSRARIPGVILFEASYLASGAAAQSAFSSLSITAQTDGAQKFIEASIEGNLDNVSEQRPGSAYLLVTNNLNVPIHINVNPVGPQDTLKLSQVAPFDVIPRSMGQTRIEVTTGHRITPGTYTIPIKLTAEWSWAGRKEKKTLIVTKPVTAGVFFESELLRALGVPSFLVLPGCLFLFTMQLFLILGVMGLKNESRLPQLTIVSPGFWIIAITFSGLFVLAYSLVTGNNYLIRYGLDDLRNVWLSSIAIGAVVYCAVAWAAKKYRSERVPTANDKPTAILRKISKNGLGIVLPEVKFKLKTLDLLGFMIEPIEEGQESVWVAPPISTNWDGAPDALNAQEKFQQNLNSKLSPEKLALELEDAEKKRYVQIQWDTRGGAMPTPFHVKVDSITEYRAPGFIVVE